MYAYVSIELSVQIRRSDKIGTEAVFHSLDEYMIHVAQYFKHRELREKVDKRRIYLATDDPSVYSEARLKYVKFIYLSMYRLFYLFYFV